MSAERFDAVVIGAGQGGGPLASALGRAGRRTAIVERAHVGGSCINFGCTPTKTLWASARVAHLARRAADFGVRAGPVSVDMAAVRARKQAVVERFRSGSQRALETSEGVELLFGQARFVGPKRVAVDLHHDGGKRELEAEVVVINTGTRAAPHGVVGLEGPRVLTATTILELDLVPEHLVVLGGGYIGCEFGQMFRRFGSRVTIVQRSARLLKCEDGDVADAVGDVLRGDGIEILFETKVLSATAGATGVGIKVRTPEGERTLDASFVLAAVGRVPNARDLGLDAAGIATDEKGYVRVNERLETNVRGVYAIGDVNGGPAFTHISYDDFRILRANLLERGKATTRGRFVPYVVFTDPQLGRVGMAEWQAKRERRDVRVVKLHMEHVARAIEMDERRGFVKAVVDARTQEILGAAVLGVEGGELMALFEVAMLGNVRWPVLESAIFAHPTLAESLNTIFAPLAGR